MYFIPEKAVGVLSVLIYLAEVIVPSDIRVNYGLCANKFARMLLMRMRLWKAFTNDRFNLSPAK